MLADPTGNRFALSVCICTHDRYDWLNEAIESLMQQNIAPESFELLVMDTSPDPDVAHVTAINQNRLAIIWRNQSSATLSQARNVAAQLCRAPIIAFMDDDALAEPDWVSNLLDIFSRLPDLAAVGGRVDPIWECAMPAWMPDNLLDHFSILNLGSGERELASHEWLCGTNIAFRTESLLSVSGFREDLGRRPGTLLSNEELAVCRRLSDSGNAVYYSAKVRVRHRVPASRCTQEWMRNRIAWQALSDVVMRANQPFRSEIHIKSLSKLLQTDPQVLAERSSLFETVHNADAFRSQCREIGIRILEMDFDSQTPEFVLGY